METIEQKYEPFNFSTTRCYVFQLAAEASGFIKIEHKLPKYIRQLKGICVTVNIQDGTGEPLTAGFISLNFNGQSLKCFHSPVVVSDLVNDCSLPYPLDEAIFSNSFVQGYFKAFTGEDWFPYTITIYLHYQ